MVGAGSRSVEVHYEVLRRMEEEGEGKDKETRGETTFLTVLNRGTGNWAGLSGATKSLITAGKELDCHSKKGVKVNRLLSAPLSHYLAVQLTI